MKRVAVVGSGVSGKLASEQLQQGSTYLHFVGLAATWMLNEHSDEYEVHLFEADSRPGGHTNTVDFSPPGSKDGPTTRVDTGFIVFNTVTYPNLLRFFDLIGVEHIASEMSFSVSRDRGLYEWAGTSLSALFAQRKNLLNPGQWRMIWDILRFNNAALELLRKGDTKESIGKYLDREGYSDSFRDNYLLPMTAAIWSTPPDTAALDFPALTLLRFMHNHHLLQLLDRPVWLTIKNGSHNYVKKVLDALPLKQYHSATPIQSASSHADGSVSLVTAAGEHHEFDHIIFACHADTTLKILESGEGITKEERAVLGGFEFGKNRAVLHSDPLLMPRIRSTWAAWNYLTSTDGLKANVNSAALTYWMNTLQSIPESTFGPVLVTLNPPYEPRKELVVGEWSYDHPLFSPESVRSQDLLPSIQNKRNMTFCGAWTKYGFHEDGFKSGMTVAQDYLKVSPPFPIHSAERAVPPPSALLTLFIDGFESVRRACEGPWEVLMLIAVFGCVGVEWSVWAAQMAIRGGGMKSVEGKMEGARKLVGSVRREFQKSAKGKQVGGGKQE
ncbi:uncharacterized protein P7C70_g3132, partial [Phenoliferia sp. Uapishka_3]